MLEEAQCFTYEEDLPEWFDRSKHYQGDLPCRQTSITGTIAHGTANTPWFSPPSTARKPSMQGVRLTPDRTLSRVEGFPGARIEADRKEWQSRHDENLSFHTQSHDP